MVGEPHRRGDPPEAGLSVDYEASVDAAGGRPHLGTPSALGSTTPAGSELDAVVAVDEERLDAAVARAARRRRERSPRDGAIRFTRTG